MIGVDKTSLPKRCVTRDEPLTEGEMSMQAVTQMFESWVDHRLGGYKHLVNKVDTALPRMCQSTQRVAVVGAGLAGLRAASLLAGRGLEVVVFEKNAYLGGKVGAWPVSLSDGVQVSVEHGFHAFFRHYYNLDGFLRELDITRSFRAIDDYLILCQDGSSFSFKNVHTTPILNILSLMRSGVFGLPDIVTNPRLMRLISMLEYHPEKTFEKFDHVSFDEFAQWVRLPKGLRLTFNSFARAFFAPGHKLSAAELLKSFHFYFLSNNHGLLYDYPDDDYSLSLLKPIERYLVDHNVSILCDTSVDRVFCDHGGYRIFEQFFDYVVLASDVVGAKQIVQASDDLNRKYPQFARQMEKLQASTRYAVLRLWTDRDVAKTMPGFVITDHLRVLDSVSFYHRLEKSSQAWVEANQGGIYELHSYSVSDEVASDAEVRDLLLQDFYDYFPSMRGCTILDEHLQVKRDFVAFHVNMHRGRPQVVTQVPRFYLAGDWVKLPVPAMLMEAACTSGLLAANQVLADLGLQQHVVYSVPNRGVW